MTNSIDLSRRSFLSMSALCLGGAALSTILPASVLAQQTDASAVSVNLSYLSSPKKIVFINLQGAPDGMELMVPYGDPNLEGLRGNIYRGRPGEIANASPLKLDDMFGVSNKLPFFQQAYNNGEYLGFHAASLQHSNRSHFDAQNMLANGTLNPAANASGWMNRLTQIVARKANLNEMESTFLTIAPYASSPLMVKGRVRPMLLETGRQGNMSDAFYDHLVNDVLKQRTIAEHQSREALLQDGLNLRKAFDGYVASTDGGEKVKEDIKQMRNDVQRAGVIGSLMSRPDGPHIAVMSLGGWDSHSAQHVDKDWGYTNTVKNLNDVVEALRTNMKGGWSNCVVIVGGEFGRTCAVNGTSGTDHGIGTSWNLLGGAVRGGRVLGDWPGLRDSDMVDGRYLRSTTNMASVFKAIVQQSFELSTAEINQIFPDSSDVAPMQGIMRG